MAYYTVYMDLNDSAGTTDTFQIESILDEDDSDVTDKLGVDQGYHYNMNKVKARKDITNAAQKYLGDPNAVIDMDFE